MEGEFKPTLFDTQIQNHNLQMLKTMIPYLNSGSQKSFALMIKYLELQKTAEVFSHDSLTIQGVSNESPQERMFRMLSDISEQCTSAEKENIDMILNMFQIMSTYDVMFS